MFAVKKYGGGQDKQNRQDEFSSWADNGDKDAISDKEKKGPKIRH